MTSSPRRVASLPRVLVAGQGIDPRLFVADAPAADLAFSGVFEGQPGERLLGTFSLSNRLAGRLDQQRLPLANMTGAVLGDIARAHFRALAIDLGAAGQLKGDGQWRDGRATLNLISPRLNLAGLHRDLNATRMRTVLQLAGDAARQTLERLKAFRIDLSHVTRPWKPTGSLFSLKPMKNSWPVCGPRKRPCNRPDTKNRITPMPSPSTNLAVPLDLNSTLDELREENVCQRLWEKDASLWKSDPIDA